MDPVISLHIFLEEHAHPALHKASGGVCATLYLGWVLMVWAIVFALGSALNYYAASFCQRIHNENWPPHVASRLRTTFVYFVFSIVIATVGGVTISQFSAVMAFLSGYSLAPIFLGTLPLVLIHCIVEATPHSVVKQLGFVAYSAIIGIMYTPLYVLGHSVMILAAWLTAATVGVASLLAIYVPPSWNQNVRPLLFVCYLLCFISSLIGRLWGTSTDMGAHAYATNLYVGLVAAAGFLYRLFDAELIGENDDTRCDSTSASILIFRMTLEVFLRIAILLAGGGNGAFKHVCGYNKAYP